MLTNGQGQKGERQKASIDRWNQELLDEPDDPGQTVGWSHDRKPPLPSHAFGLVDQMTNHQQRSQDHSGSFPADPYSGHQPSRDHAPGRAQSPARQYNPYDLSPAYLGNYPDEPENPSNQYDGYSADASHVRSHHDSPACQQPHSSQKQPNVQGTGCWHGEQNKGYAPQDPHYYNHSYDQSLDQSYEQSYDQSYAPQHEQLTSQAPSGHSRQPLAGRSHQAGNHTRASESTATHAKAAMPQEFSYHGEHQPQPYNATSGWDDDPYLGYGGPAADQGGPEAPVPKPFDASQFREPLQAYVRPRGNKQKGRGRSTQQPYRPDQQRNVSSQQQVSCLNYCLHALASMTNDADVGTACPSNASMSAVHAVAMQMRVWGQLAACC